MKKAFFSIILLGVMSLSVYSFSLLNKGGETEKNIENERTIPFNIIFPEGTTFSEEGSSILFELPSGYYILGVDEDGTFYRSGDGGKGKVTCTCNSGNGGCSPAEAQGQYGCVMTTCTKCTKSESIAEKPNRLEKMMIIGEEPTIGFITKFEEADRVPLLPSQFLEAEEIRDLLTAFEKNFISSESETTKIVLINVLGYVLPVEVPSDIDNISVSLAAGKTKCNCETTGKCPKKQALIAVYCDASNCKSCSLSSSAISPNNDEEKEFSVEDGVVRLK